MGVNLRDLFPSHPVPAEWYHGKRIAIDGHNVSYRYLTTIRAKDGDVLRNADGRATSHLYGTLGLIANLRSRGAEPIWIWDGPVHPRKQATVNERIRLREATAERALAAQLDGDEALYRKLLRGTTWLTGDMIEDATTVLEGVGVPVVQADHDGERYAAGLCHAGHADAVATEDFDALVAGAPRVLRKAGGAEPFMHRFTDLDLHGLSPKQLHQVAVLCGTDWHPGVKGFGAKTAVKALAVWPDLRALFEEADAGDDSTRYHKMVAKSDLDATTFDELETFVADIPHPAAPPRLRPDPAKAAVAAEQAGMDPARLMSCFC